MGRSDSHSWCLDGRRRPQSRGDGTRVAHRGLSRSDIAWVAPSMVLSALVVAWCAAGVLRGRTVRLVLVWLLLGIGTAFCSTDYLRRQRAHPDVPRPDISALVAVALVVGLLGGMTAPADGGNPPTQLRISL